MAEECVHTFAGIGRLRGSQVTLKDVSYTIRVDDDGNGGGTIYADFVQLPPLQNGEAVLHMDDGQLVAVQLHLICLNEQRAEFTTVGRVALQ